MTRPVKKYKCYLGPNSVNIHTPTNMLVHAMSASRSHCVINGHPVSGSWSLRKTMNGGMKWGSAGFFLPQAGINIGLLKTISGTYTGKIKDPLAIDLPPIKENPY